MIILFVLLVYILGLIIFLISNAFAHCDEGKIFLGQVILAPFWFIVLPYRKLSDIIFMWSIRNEGIKYKEHQKKYYKNKKSKAKEELRNGNK